MFFDYEDVLMCIAVMAGFLMIVGLLAWLHRWPRIWRGLLIFVAIFILSDVTEHLARYWFHDLPRGTNFYRVFLASLIVFGIYAYTTRQPVQEAHSEHTHKQEAS